MTKRQIEIFSAGCAVCTDAIHLVQKISCSSCEVTVHDMSDAKVASRAKTLGVQSVPAIAVDGKLVDCCSGRGVDEALLKQAGIGKN